MQQEIEGHRLTRCVGELILFPFYAVFQGLGVASRNLDALLYGLGGHVGHGEWSSAAQLNFGEAVLGRVRRGAGGEGPRVGEGGGRRGAVSRSECVEVQR
jgi:hypothetical protein